MKENSNYKKIENIGFFSIQNELNSNKNAKYFKCPFDKFVHICNMF